MPVPQTCSIKQRFPFVRKLPASGIHRLSISQKAGLFRFVKTYGTAGSFTRHPPQGPADRVDSAIPFQLIRRRGTRVLYAPLARLLLKIAI